eukprot:m.64767 g.64767  ORF g.64767 m.64767 type:complete len:335 (+) comp13507_c1_seq5:245-1249(+)
MALDASEATQYDRQIRLWGLDAQKRIRNARLLVFGAGGLSVEVCKNLVLAGVKSLTLCDPAPTSEADLSAQFFLRASDLGQPRADATVPRLQALNPKVVVSVGELSLSNLSTETLADTDVVIATGCSFAQAAAADEVCRATNVKFFFGNAFGFSGFFFQDLGHHEFLLEKKSLDVDDTSTSELHTLDFASLQSVLQHTFQDTRKKALPWLFLALRVIEFFQEKDEQIPLAFTEEVMTQVHHFLDQLGVAADCRLSADYLERVAAGTQAELCTATSIVGGVLGGEIIKAISGKDEPINNLFCFDGFESSGLVYELGTVSQVPESNAQDSEMVIEL